MFSMAHVTQLFWYQKSMTEVPTIEKNC